LISWSSPSHLLVSSAEGIEEIIGLVRRWIERFVGPTTTLV